MQHIFLVAQINYGKDLGHGSCAINFPFWCSRPFQCVCCVRQAWQFHRCFIYYEFSGWCIYFNFQSKTSRWCEFRWITIGPVLTLSVHNLAPKPWKLWMRVTLTYKNHRDQWLSWGLALCSRDFLVWLVLQGLGSGDWSCQMMISRG